MLTDLVLVQKRELENRLQETYVERKIPLPWDLGNDLIKVITGPRQAGKSFYAVHLLREIPGGRVYTLDKKLLSDA